MAKKNHLPEKLDDTSVLDMEFFRGDLEEMYDGVSKIDDLADRLDRNVNDLYFQRENREMMSRGTLPFISEQINTLASLRTSKASTLNQIMSNKIKMSQLAISKTKSDTTGGVDANTIAREFQKLFLDPKNRRPEDLPENQFKQLKAKPDTVSKSEDELLSQRINELTTNGSLKLTDNELAMKYEHTRIEMQVVSNAGNPMFVAVNANTNEILTDYPATLLPNINDLVDATVTENQFICKNGNKYNRYR